MHRVIVGDVNDGFEGWKKLAGLTAFVYN